MKNQFSVVIICKNEAEAIKPVLESIQNITDDIVIYDSGSTDNTAQVAQAYPNVQWHTGPWEGFGKTKGRATQLAKHDWILSLDADEAPDAELQHSLATTSFNDATTVYNIAYKNFLGKQHIKWGEWGFDKHIRLFNRQQVTWNDAPVHEALIFPPGVKVQPLKGHLLHRTVKDVAEYSRKVVQYALLNAEKYHAKGKKATWIKRYVAPLFAFIKFYVFMLGFLDGWCGLVCARMTAYYTFLKYARLYELQQGATESNNPKAHGPQS